jgi:hypothetical protein
LTTVEGDRHVEREVYLYSTRGIYEICRRSQQPKADQFFDWVYDILEGLRRGELQLLPPGAVRELLSRLSRLEDKLARLEGRPPAALLPAGENPAAPEEALPHLTAADIARLAGIYSVPLSRPRDGRPPRPVPHSPAVNAIAAHLDLDERERVLVPYTHSRGKTALAARYSPAVAAKIAAWLAGRGWPKSLALGGKTYRLQYLRPAGRNGGGPHA